MHRNNYSGVSQTLPEQIEGYQTSEISYTLSSSRKGEYQTIGYKDRGRLHYRCHSHPPLRIIARECKKIPVIIKWIKHINKVRAGNCNWNEKEWNRKLRQTEGAKWELDERLWRISHLNWWILFIVIHLQRRNWQEVGNKRNTFKIKHTGRYTQFQHFCLDISVSFVWPR